MLPQPPALINMLRVPRWMNCERTSPLSCPLQRQCACPQSRCAAAGRRPSARAHRTLCMAGALGVIKPACLCLKLFTGTLCCQVGVRELQ